MALLFSLPISSSSSPTSSSSLLPPSTSIPLPRNPAPLHPLSLSSFTKIPPPASRLSFASRPTPPLVMETMDLDFGEEEGGGGGGAGGGMDLEDSPWEGAVVYQRDASVTHLEYSTTLERLGLEKISSDLSRSRAAEMGLRVMPRRGAIDPSLVGGTPVLVSIDVTRKKKKLKVDGIVRTVITLLCNRCGEPAAESVFSNFTLLLTEEPIEEPDEINLGVLFGNDKSRTSGLSLGEEDDEDSLIDLDDRLYFPVEENEIDISKHIRDIVHVEITINSTCDPKCKGLCLKCGANLNKRHCSCNKGNEVDTEYGPLKDLKIKMQQR